MRSVGSGFGSVSLRRRRRAIYPSCRDISRGRSGRAWRKRSRDAVKPRGPQQMGGVDIILFAWQRRERTDLLIMALSGIGENLEAAALVAEPNDERTLRLRAGPDAEVLKGRSAVLFGAGALGGHVAVTLAESGIDSLKIVDGDLLSPGNVVRHVAGHDQVGGSKVNAVEGCHQESRTLDQGRVHSTSGQPLRITGDRATR